MDRGWAARGRHALVCIGGWMKADELLEIIKRLEALVKTSSDIQIKQDWIAFYKWVKESHEAWGRCREEVARLKLSLEIETSRSDENEGEE